MRGTFQARRGQAPSLVAPGIYAGGGRTVAVVDDPYGPARLVDLDSGERPRASIPRAAASSSAPGCATREPTKGTARFGPASSAVIDGAPSRGPDSPAGSALPQRRRHALGDADGAAGRRAASGGRVGARLGTDGAGLPPRPQAILLHHGVAVLAYDKRGVGQSGGSYPGESPYPSTIDVLARDAEAAVRFLPTRPEIDRDRIGLAGHSQAGWIIPLAASREPAVRFAVIFSGPAVTADENDNYQNLTGEGERRRR